MTAEREQPLSPAGEYDHLLPVFKELAALPEGSARRAELRDHLVAEHSPVAQNIARRFRGRGESIEDLVQVALMGLINAVDRYDPERGTDFLAFAIPTIMGEVRRYFRDASWAVRVPRRLKELHLTLGNASTTLSQRLGRAPTARELAEHLNLSPEEVYEGLEAGHAYHAASLFDAGSEGAEETSLANTLGDQDSALEEVENRAAIYPLIRELPERERTIVVLRFFGNLTQTQIAERVGISQMHVSRLLATTLRKLRGRLSDEG